MTLVKTKMTTYFTGEYSYRTRHVLAGGLIATLLGSVFPIGMIISALKNRRYEGVLFSDLPILIFSVGIPCLLLFVGLWLIWSWKTDRAYTLVISEVGIQWGKTAHTWEQITRLACSYERGKPILFYQPKGAYPEQLLTLTSPLTQQDVEKLFDLLRNQVAPRHTGLRIG